MIKQLDGFEGLKKVKLEEIEHIIITTHDNEYVITAYDLQKILSQPMFKILLQGLFK